MAMAVDFVPGLPPQGIAVNDLPHSQNPERLNQPTKIPDSSVQQPRTGEDDQGWTRREEAYRRGADDRQEGQPWKRRRDSRQPNIDDPNNRGEVIVDGHPASKRQSLGVGRLPELWTRHAALFEERMREQLPALYGPESRNLFSMLLSRRPSTGESTEPRTNPKNQRRDFELI